MRSRIFTRPGDESEVPVQELELNLDGGQIFSNRFAVASLLLAVTRSPALALRTNANGALSAALDCCDGFARCPPLDLPCSGASCNESAHGCGSSVRDVRETTFQLVRFQVRTEPSMHSMRISPPIL